MLNKAANYKWRRITQHQNSTSYLSCHWKDTQIRVLNAYKRAQVLAQKNSHTCLALSSFILMKVKHYPRTALLSALRTGHWTIGESFLRQHLLSHFSVNHKPLTSFQSHLLNKNAGGLEDAKLSLRKLALQRSWWNTLWKAHSTWNWNNIHDICGKRNKMTRTLKSLPCINICNEFFLNGIFRRNYQDVRILPPLANLIQGTHMLVDATGPSHWQGRPPNWWTLLKKSKRLLKFWCSTTWEGSSQLQLLTHINKTALLGH